MSGGMNGGNSSNNQRRPIGVSSIGSSSGGNTTNRRTNDQLSTFVRQSTILRKNFIEWDRVLNTAQRGEDWTTMIGRYNAAYHQIVQVDTSIDDVMEHFVYVPNRATANPQDIPFFLSTRLEAPPLTNTAVTSPTTTNDAVLSSDVETTTAASSLSSDPVKRLMEYEDFAAQLVHQYEQSMIRF